MSSLTTHVNPATARVAKDWDAYYRNAKAAHAQGGRHHSALAQFWSTIFDQAFVRAQGSLQALDVGCGTGAVARFASVFGGARDPDLKLRVWGLDYSHAALNEVRRQAPVISCIAGDATHIPFADQSFHLVTSQFGIEYAGPDALCEAARVLRPGGLLATALHVRNGGIYKECRINRQAVDTVRDCNLLGLFRDVVKGFYYARSSHAGKQLLRTTYAKFAGAVAATEQILRRWGRGVASGMVFHLHRDVVRMVQRIQAFNARELITWAEWMSTELANYSLRMVSMLKAALSREMVGRLTARMQRHGLQIELRNLLRIESMPVAWMVTATKTT